MKEDYPELQSGQHVDKEGMHPGRLRRFVSHLSSAAIKAEERSAKKNEIKRKLESVRSVSLNKRSTKQSIEEELRSFEKSVHDIINDEEKILEEQRRETRQVSELKRMVENLSKRLIGIGEEYNRELDDKDRKILELREALAAAHIRISESGEERQKKIDDIEKKLKERHDLPPPPEPPKTKDDHIAELESHLRTMEQKHAELKEAGIHKQEDLDRVHSLIVKHKQALAKLKGVELPALTPAQPALNPQVKKKFKKSVPAKRNKPVKKTKKKR